MAACGVLLALAVPAGAETPPPPRLSGIVVSGEERIAILAENDDRDWRAAHEGESDGLYRVESIAPDHVVLVGPEGAVTMRVEESGEPRPVGEPIETGQTPVEQGARDLGQSAGLAAARFDACVGRGLLASTQDGTAISRVLAVVAAMARLPAIPDPNGGSATQPSALAEWIRIGAETGLRGRTDIRDRGECEMAARTWAEVAGRLGAR